MKDKEKVLYMSRDLFKLSIILLFCAMSCCSNKHVARSSAKSFVEAEKYPFIASLRISSRLHICGSTIIAPSWVLTAAHCIKNLSVDHFSVQFATNRLSPLGRNVAGVMRIIVHEDYYRANVHANNIALLELRRPLKLDNKTLAAVTLPEQNFEVFQVKSGVSVGWRQKAINGSLQTSLQEVQLQIHSDEECIRSHNGSTTDNNICASPDNVACFRDSGGPLLHMGSTQLGIASWIKRSVPCSAQSYSIVYTKVSHYIEWINKHIS